MLCIDITVKPCSTRDRNKIYTQSRNRKCVTLCQSNRVDSDDKVNSAHNQSKF